MGRHKKNKTEKVKKIKVKKIKIEKVKGKRGRKPKQEKVLKAESQISIRERKSKLSPKEQEAKQFKKEFNRQANYFKFLKKAGNLATKDYKRAKQELKKGKPELAKKMIAKYTLLDINAWVKATE